MSNFKKMVEARMENTGESWQVAQAHVRSQDDGGIATILAQLEAHDTFGVLIRQVGAGTSHDASVLFKRAEELAARPMYSAQTGRMSVAITERQKVILRAAGASEGTPQIIRTFVPEMEPFRTFSFSVQCTACDRWIWCGTEKRADVCVCGHPYRVVFDLASGHQWSQRRGRVCLDCGAENILTRPEENRNPWRWLNLFQAQCNACATRPTVTD